MEFQNFRHCERSEAISRNSKFILREFQIYSQEFQNFARFSGASPTARKFYKGYAPKTPLKSRILLLICVFGEFQIFWGLGGVFFGILEFLIQEFQIFRNSRIPSVFWGYGVFFALGILDLVQEFQNSQQFFISSFISFTAVSKPVIVERAIML